MVTSAGVSESLPGPTPRPMTRCECTEITFEEIADRMDAESIGMEEVCRRTQSATICTACLPDLVRFIAERTG